MFSPPRTVIFSGRSPVWPAHNRLYSLSTASCGFLYIITHLSYFSSFGTRCVLMTKTVPSVVPSPGNPFFLKLPSLYTDPVRIPEEQFHEISWDSNLSNYDTSNRFGTNTLYGSLCRKIVRATQNFNMAAIFQDVRHGLSWNSLFCQKMAADGRKWPFW